MTGKFESPPTFAIRAKIKARVCSASRGDRLPKAPVLIGRKRANASGYAWSIAHDTISGADAADYARGAVVMIAVPGAIAGLGLDDCVAALVPWAML